MTYQLPKVWSAVDSDQGKFSGQGDDYARGTTGSRGDRGSL